MDILPKFPWISHSSRPEFYACKCNKCGFQQVYETGNFETIVPDGVEEDTSILHVDKVPAECPKCGGRLSRTHLKSPIRY